MRDATPSNITVYDAFVSAAAQAGALDTYNGSPVSWQVLGSTAAVSAISRVPLTSPALYLPTGELVATGGADLWDGSISHAINVDEFGLTRTVSPWTGTDLHGGQSSLPLGSTSDTTDGFSNTTFFAWIQNSTDRSFTSHPLYGVSAILTVPGTAAVPEPGTLALLGAGALSAGLWGRRRRTRPSA